jgi:hypothetical protein
VSGTIQEFSTLIAAGVGALAAYLAGAATERTRWRRERSGRWDDRRAQAYAEYAHAVKDVYVQCMRAYGLRGKRAVARAAYREALTELERLTDDRTAKWEAVLLLGDPEAIKAGRTWHRRVWQVERYFDELMALLQRTSGRPEPDEVASLRTRYDIEQITAPH